MATAIALIALFSIAAFVLSPEQLLGRPKTAYLGSLTGTFVNRNTAAAFFAVGSLVSLGLCLIVLRDRLGVWRPGQMKDVLLHGLPSQAGLALAGSACSLVALGMTGSRAGILLFGCAALVLLLTYFTEAERRASAKVIIAFLLVLALALVVELVGGRATERLERFGLLDLARLETYRISLQMIADRPWVGFGHGSFETAFSAYRSAELGSFGVWDRAHNTLIEIAIELGLPAAAIVLAIWLLGILMLARTAFRQKASPVTRGICAIAMTIAGMAGMHSLVDFPLQIPGYGVIFAAVAGAGMARAMASDRDAQTG
jgi:O-antigen ligase